MQYAAGFGHAVKNLQHTASRDDIPFTVSPDPCLQTDKCSLAPPPPRSAHRVALPLS